jgi:hypothetical protein
MEKDKMSKLLKNNIFLISLYCLITTVVFYSPFLISSLRGYQPEFRFLGDLHLAGFPLFVQLGKYFSQYTYFGIDFFTANGSSSLFIRPNVPAFYPPQLILETLIRTNSNINSAKLFLFQIWAVGFIGMFFTALWMKSFAKLSIYQSIFGGAIYIGVVTYVYSQPGFLYVVLTLPVLIYCFSYGLERETNTSQKILLSLPIVSIITAGYLPIGIMAYCIGLVGVIFIAQRISNEKLDYKSLLFINLIGLFVVFFYLVTIINVVSIVPAVPKSPLTEWIFFDQLSLTLRGAMSIFFGSIPNDSGEAPHFRLGLPFILLLYIGYEKLSKPSYENSKNIFIACLLLTGMALLMSMGKVSGLADMFFYTVPGLGGMHIYARYLLTTVFFLVFALSLGLSNIEDDKTNLKIPILVISIASLILIFFPDVLIKNQISPLMLFIEILISFLLIVALRIKGDDKKFIILIPLLLAHQGSFTYLQTNWMTGENPGPSYIDVVNSPARTNALVDYMFNNSEKLLVKYIDITPEIEKKGGVPQNFPWSIRYKEGERRRISSYMGYEQGLSMQLEYAQRFSYFGKYDKNYLVDSGVDFMIFNSATKIKEGEWLTQVIDPQIPVLSLGYDFFVAKIKEVNRGTSVPVISNGIFNIYTSAGPFSINNFKNNWSSSIELDFESQGPSILRLNLFPHKYWTYSIDGNVVIPKLSQSGLAEFELPAGIHIFKMSYVNYSNFIFLWIYFIYLLAIFLIFIRFFIIKLSSLAKTLKRYKYLL